MGEILDLDGDKVTLEVDFGRAESFLTFVDDSILEIREQTSKAGVYPIEITLTDDSDTEEATVYKISFIILESDQDTSKESTLETDSETQTEEGE